MSKHEIPDDAGNPQIPPLQIPPSLLAKLKQQSGQDDTPVYRVGRDGEGHLEKPGAPTEVPEGDLRPLLDGIEKMSTQLRQTVDSMPEARTEDFRIPAEILDTSTRLALVHAGNAIDYALRRVEDISRTARITRLRSELAHEMKAAGLEGDPNSGMTPA